MVSGLNYLGQSRVTIIGLGLMGGSLARGIRPYTSHITAIDPLQASLASAMDEGVIDFGTADLEAGLAGAEMVLLATPVKSILELIWRLPAFCPTGCLVLDLGSTKSEICEAMDALPPHFQAIGGHPMCGKENSGYEAADGALYQGQTFVLCRTTRTTPLVEQVALEILAAVGARSLFLPPTLHDNLVSLTSHLPYLISSLLMRQAAKTAESQTTLWQVSASGFRDSSRLAGSSPEVMGDILMTNREPVLAQLEEYRRSLDGIIELLENGPDAELMRWLRENKIGYETYQAALRIDNDR